MRYYGRRGTGPDHCAHRAGSGDKMLRSACGTHILRKRNFNFTITWSKEMWSGTGSSVEAGVQLRQPSELTAKNVMARPIQAVGDIVSVHDVDA